VLGLAVIDNWWLMSASTKTFCEFFAGIGLVHKGLHEGGWQCVYANDIDAKKQAMYVDHFGDAPHYHLEDVWQTDEVTRRLPQTPFLATASFPCTNMSLAGNMQGFDGAQSSAFFGFTRAVQQLPEPLPVVMLENVVGFLTAHRGADFRAAVEHLAGMGYWMDAFILDAKYFTPQSRPRLFVIGVHQQLIEKLDSQPDSPWLCNRPADALAAGAWRQAVEDSGTLRSARLTQAMLQTPLPTGWATRPLSPPQPSGGLLTAVIDTGPDVEWWDKPSTLRHYNMLSDAHRQRLEEIAANGQTFASTGYRRMRSNQQRLEVRFDGLAGCLRTPRGGSARQIVVAVIDGKIHMRWMSPREYARLQGAGDFRFKCSERQALFGFGDAVCVPAIEWIDQQILTPLYNRAL